MKLLTKKNAAQVIPRRPSQSAASAQRPQLLHSEGCPQLSQPPQPVALSPTTARNAARKRNFFMGDLLSQLLEEPPLPTARLGVSEEPSVPGFQARPGTGRST